MSKRRVPNVPRIIGWSLALILIICVIAFFVRLAVWNKGVKYTMTDEDIASIKLDTKDNITILPASIYRPDTDDGVPTILILGNDSFYEGTDNGTGIIDYVTKELPDATIINCCFPGSQLACYNALETSPEECPDDYFTLFYLTLAANLSDYSRQDNAMNYLDAQKQAIYKPILERYKSVDFSSVDIIIYCYDGHDYLNGVNPTTEITSDVPDVSTVLGSLVLSSTSNSSVYPGTQYIIISPTFCYATDENGKKISGNIYNNGYGTIADFYSADRATSNYSGLSFMDMLCGVDINEETADKYLEDDGITPNKTGRKMIADRIVILLKNRL